MWESLGGGERQYNSSRRVRLPNLRPGSAVRSSGPPTTTASSSEVDSRGQASSLLPSSSRSLQSPLDQLAADVGASGFKPPKQLPSVTMPQLQLTSRIDDGDGSGARLMHLESRLSAAERGNRALLEELVRWQSDLKAISRQQDEARREERREVLHLRANTASNNDDITQLTQRLQGTEDQVALSRQSQHNFNDQLKRLQQMVIDNHQTTTAHQDQLTMRLERWQQDMKHTVEHLARTQDDTERHVAGLTEETRQLRSVQENRTVEFQAALAEIRTNIKRCLSEQQAIMINASENQTKLTQLTAECNKLAPMMYDGLKQVEKTVGDVQNNLSYHQREAESRWVALAEKTKGLDSAHASHVKLSAQMLDDQEKALRELSQCLEVERTQTTQQLSALLETQRTDVAEATAKLDEQLRKRATDLEGALEREKDARLHMAAECQTDIAARSELIQREIQEHLGDFKATAQVQQLSIESTLRQLHDRIRLNEEHLRNDQQRTEHVLHAEIQTRRSDDEKQARATTQVNQRFESAVATVQQTVAALAAQIADSREKVQLQWKIELASHLEAVDRSAADADARLNTLGVRMGVIEGASRSLSDQVSRDQDELQRKQRESLASWQKATGKKLQELAALGEVLPKEISDVKEKLLAVNTSLSSQLETERQNRLHERQSYHQDLATKLPRGMFERLQTDLGRQLNTLDTRLTKAMGQLRECEDAVRISQTNLGSKMNSETNARMEVAVEVNQRVAKIRGEVDYLLQQNHQRYDNVLRDGTPPRTMGRDGGDGWASLGGTFNGSLGEESVEVPTQQHVDNLDAEESAPNASPPPRTDSIDTAEAEAEEPEKEEQEEQEKQEEEQGEQEEEEKEEQEEEEGEEVAESMPSPPTSVPEVTVEEDEPPPEVNPRSNAPIETRMIFVQPLGEKDKDSALSNVNQWGFLNVITWGIIKKRWLQLLSTSATPAARTPERTAAPSGMDDTAESQEPQE